MTWLPTNYEDAVFAELPANEQARDHSFYHPSLALFHKERPAPDFQEWGRIGITADSLPLPEGMSVEDRIAELFPEIEPSDPRLIHKIKRLSKGSPHVHARCGSCGTWHRPTELIDVRNYPEVAERPILDYINRDYFDGSLVEVIDNAATERNEDTGEIIGPEVRKMIHRRYSRPSVVGYETIIDFKRGAGFVCSGCWTLWIRLRLKIGGLIYTRLQHIILLDAPRDTIDEHKDRPGWNTPGLTDF